MEEKMDDLRRVATAAAAPSPTAAENDPHARVLLAIHKEFLDFGLEHEVEEDDSDPAELPLFEQSAAGAFSPLRYADVHGGRVIMVHALSMFDDLIVNATATLVPSKQQLAAVAAATGGEAMAIGKPGARGDEAEEESGAVRRRKTFNVCRWSPVLLSNDEKATAALGSGRVATTAAAHRRGASEGREQQGDDECGQQVEDTVARRTAGTAGEEAGGNKEANGKPPSSQLREEFRARVLSGFLLHLCPPAGHFADLFGCGEDVRRRVLRVLDARDLTSFGLASRAAAASAAADSLWAPLVEADFSTTERLALEKKPSSSAPQVGTSAADPAPVPLDKDGHPASGERNSGRDNSCCFCSGSSVGAGAGAGAGAGGGGGGGEGHRHLYARLATARALTAARVAAEEAEQARRASVFEMAALGRLGRRGLYSSLPRGPYHTPGPPPTFQGYSSWVPGLGGGGGGLAVGVDDGTGALVPPRSLFSSASSSSPIWGWGRRSGWRSALGGWGVGGGGGVFGSGSTSNHRGGAHPSSYGEGRRGGGFG